MSYSVAIGTLLNTPNSSSPGRNQGELHRVSSRTDTHLDSSVLRKAEVTYDSRAKKLQSLQNQRDLTSEKTSFGSKFKASPYYGNI